jgi:hypothetical protein
MFIRQLSKEWVLFVFHNIVFLYIKADGHDMYDCSTICAIFCGWQAHPFVKLGSILFSVT